MPEQIICNIVRPVVGVTYIAESPEAAAADLLAACYLSLDAMAKEIRHRSGQLGVGYPEIIENLLCLRSKVLGV